MSQIHPTAVIDAASTLGRDVLVGPGVIIDGPVKIGDRTRLIAQVYLTGDTTIGCDCEIHPFACIGGPPQDYGFQGEPSSCVIGDRTVVREHVTIHRGTKPGTITEVGSDCMLMACSHVAHNCRIEDRVILANNVMLGGYVTIGHHTFMAGGAAIHQHVRIGEYAMVGGVAKATQDVAPFTMVTERNLCTGINRVGLIRNDFAKEDLDELRSLHRLIMRSQTGMKPAALALRDSVRTTSGRRLIEFVLSAGTRGVCGYRRSRQRGCEPTA